MIVAGCGMEGEHLSAPLWDSVVIAVPETELAQQIAYGNGFRHIRQFCRDYKHLFGELPSETPQRG